MVRKKKAEEEPKFCCDVCPLKGKSKSFHLPPEGPDDAEILIIGEAPGADEDEYRMPKFPNGRPFIGRSGEVLRNALNKLGILGNCKIDNTVKCRPPKNATPGKKLIDLCFPFTEEMIKNMPNLKLIVLVGNVPLQAVMGQKGGVKSLSGKVFDYPKDPKIKVMPIIHPASVLYEPKNLRLFLGSVAKIPDALAGEQEAGGLGQYAVVRDIDQWRMVKEDILRQSIVSFDVETIGLNPFKEESELRCIGFSFRSGTGITLPLDNDKWSYEEFTEIGNDIREIFENPNIKKIAQNAKFDMNWIRAWFLCDIKGLWRDVGITEYVINSKEWPNLKDMAWDYTDMGGYEKKILGNREAQDVSKEDSEDLYIYNGADNDATFRIMVEQEKILDFQPKSRYVIDNLMIPFTMALHRAECRGIRIDPTVIRRATEDLDDRIKTLNEELYNHKDVLRLEEELGVPFNTDADTHVRKILFEYQKLVPEILTEKHKLPSVSKEALMGFIKKSRVAKLLIDNAAYDKMRNTFIANLTKSICPDLRIHTNFNIVSTVTTRTSSDNPNLQNIPTRDNDFIGIRKAFVADKGYVLVEFDFNQHELRVMADEARDTVMMEDLMSGDIHTATTAECLQIDPKNVTKQQRRDIGKVINFGLIYGMTEFGLKDHLNVDLDTAREYLGRYFNRYKGIAKWRIDTERSVRKNGYVDIRSGFRRHFPIISDLDDKAVRKIMRTALNVPVQGLAGNILGYAFIGVDEFLSKTKSYIVLEVHDSILTCIHKSEIDLIPKIKEIMVSHFKPHIPDFVMPLDVDAKIGENWSDMEEMK